MSVLARALDVDYRHNVPMAKQHSGTAYDREVGRRIRKERLARGLSQERLAAKLPGMPVITHSQFAKKERGEEQIPIDLIRRVALALDIPAARLLEKETQPPSELRAHGLAARLVVLDDDAVALFEQLLALATKNQGRRRKPRAA